VRWALAFMMHLRELVVFTLFVVSATRRRNRTHELRQDAQQRNNRFMKALEVSAESRETFLPAGPMPRAPLAPMSRAPLSAVVGPCRASVALTERDARVLKANLERAQALRDAYYERVAVEKAVAEAEKAGMAATVADIDAALEEAAAHPDPLERKARRAVLEKAICKQKQEVAALTAGLEKDLEKAHQIIMLHKRGQAAEKAATEKVATEKFAADKAAKEKAATIGGRRLYFGELGNKLNSLLPFRGWRANCRTSTIP